MDLSTSIAENLKNERASREAAAPAAEVVTPAPAPTPEPIPPVAATPTAIPEAIPPVIVNETKPPAEGEPALLDQDILDHINFLNGTPEPSKQVVPGEQVPEAAKKEIDLNDEKVKPFITKAQEYDKMASDPFFKAIMEYRKGGGDDIQSFLKDIAGDNYDNLTPEALYKMDLSKLPGITTEDIDEEMEKFEGMSKVEKLRLITPIKSELKRQQEERVKAFSLPPDKNKELRTQAAQTAVPELDDTISKMVGKKHLALSITPEMGQEIRDYVMARTEEKFDANGNFQGYDIAGSVESAIFKLYSKSLLKATADAVRAHTLDEALKLRQRPNRLDEPAGGQQTPTRDLRSAMQGMTDKKWNSKI